MHGLTWTPFPPQLQEGRPSLRPQARGDQHVQHPAPAAHPREEARVSHGGEDASDAPGLLGQLGLRVPKQRVPEVGKGGHGLSSFPGELSLL